MSTPQNKRHGFSKSRLLLHCQCPKRLWLKVNRPELGKVDDDNQSRFATGAYVGEVAQQLYPDGVQIDDVGTNGPVFVYNAPFERSRIQELAE